MISIRTLRFLHYEGQIHFRLPPHPMPHAETHEMTLSLFVSLSVYLSVSLKNGSISKRKVVLSAFREEKG